MATTYSNMGLTSWNLGADNFSYTDLDANWAKVDVHDHSTGKGVQIPTAGIADNAVTSAKILDSAVTSAKIANGTIVSADIASGAVTGGNIAATTIAAGNILDAAVTSRKAKLDIVGTSFSPAQVLTGTAFLDITGATFSVTPTVASYLLIVATIGHNVVKAVSGADGIVSTQMLLDGGTAVAGNDVVITRDLSGTATVQAPSVMVAKYTLTAAAHTIKLQAKRYDTSVVATAVAGSMWGILVSQ